MPSAKNPLAHASQEAARLHARLKLDMAQPIDVFRVVQGLGIWLMSQQLGSLFGFYLREGDATGICLNVEHPETLQRYTCAHELGHHFLGHASHLDSDDEVNGHGVADRVLEQQAQAFAGAFLMPLGSINRVLSRCGLTGRTDLTAVEAYVVSRELDVSYAAAVWRLVGTGHIRRDQATAYVRAGAAAAKRILRGGPPVGSARVDLWVVERATEQIISRCREGDEILVRLPENRSTGYVWQIAGSDDSANAPAAGVQWDGADGLGDGGSRANAQPRTSHGLTVARDRHISRDLSGELTAADPTRLGVRTEWLDLPIGVPSGRREIEFVAGPVGEGAVSLELRAPWDEAAHPLAEVRVEARVAPAHAMSGGPAEAQKRRYLTNRAN